MPFMLVMDSFKHLALPREGLLSKEPSHGQEQCPCQRVDNPPVTPDGRTLQASFRELLF
jgi:hypothetical protein